MLTGIKTECSKQGKPHHKYDLQPGDCQRLQFRLKVEGNKWYMITEAEKQAYAKQQVNEFAEKIKQYANESIIFIDGEYYVEYDRLERIVDNLLSEQNKEQ